LIQDLQNMVKFTVYGTPVSVYVRIVRLLLEETGTAYDLKPIDIFNGENQSAEYLAKNPFGKVPTLEVDGEFIYETTAITGYLDTAVANHQFSPSDPLLQARMHQIMGIVDSHLYTPAIGSIAIQRLIVPSQGGKTDEAKVEAAVAPVKLALEAIEALTAGSPYLLTHEMTIADLYLIPVFIYLSQTPEFERTTAQTSKLRTWWNQVSQLPSVKKVCA
jgi:glutathione S-transferase